MSGLKERLAKLSPEQRRKLLEKLAAREGGGAPPTPPSVGEESKAAASSAEAQDAGTPGAAAQEAVAQEAVAPGTAAASTIIPRAPRDGSPLPVSFAQQRLWFLDQMQPGNPFYNVPSALRFQGRLRPGALALTLSALSLRQEALRVRFPARDGQPVQVVAEAAAVPLPTVDLSALEPKRRIATALALTAAEARAPFHLARGPLARFRLLRLSSEDHVLLLNFHHIIADGWSLGVLVKELETLYASAYHREQESREAAGDVTAAIAAVASTLPPLPVQYADFAVWQRRELGGGELERQLGYWREKLADLPTLDLPKDRPRPVFQRFRGRRHELRVPAPVLEALESRWTGGEQTLFMVLLAAFSSFLARITHQRDIVVGSPIANRGQRELEALVGFFVNSLVLRSDLSGDPTFHAAAEGARAVALEAYDHQDVPFEKLVEELQPERHLASNPLFQVVLALQNAPVGRLELPEVEVSLFGADGEVTCRFDLQLDLWPGDGADEGALVGALQYDVDLFDATTIARLGEAFLTLLAGAAQQPRTPISQLPLLDQAQRQQLVEIGAAREVPTAPGGDEALADSPNLWARFLDVARRQPDSVAVRCEERSLTYGQLAIRALTLGRRLVAQGVQPEDRVGLALERSEALVEALLGILAAGAAYLPLDPDYPQERLAYLLEDSGAAAVITRRGLLESLPPLGETPAVLVDDLAADSETAVDSYRESGLGEDGLPPVGRDHAAYVIYTSGTTGRPKGVVIPHGRVQRLFDISQPYFHFGPQDVWTLFHSVSFDFSVWELWGALAYGGELVVVPYLTSRSPEAFLELLEQRRVTVLNQTPSAFLALDRADADGRRSAALALRWVVFGGEALDVATLAPWYRDRGNDAQLVNMYGITETTVHVTYQLLRPEDSRPSSQDGVPENTGAIGRPLEDLSHQVLDSEGRLLPLGVPGELQVGGAGVARGYLGRPALTADRFRPDPLGATPGARLYRTGDLVRHRGDGSLVYLGRIDHQVKVRGFRIELGEIEAALTAHPAVARSLVMLRSGEDSGAQSGDENLVAYVVQARGLGGDERDQVGQWNEVFDETYGRGERFEEESPDFNISGWDSHVTGGEIPAPEMGRWLEDTLEGIEARLQGLASPQRRVLEIGCGTGMILFRVAPDCDRYVGTDLSAEALAYVERHLGDELSPRVELLERPGTDFSALQTASFDAVVINSVIQYFPSGEYLERVITRAVDVLAPGGFLFLGDLRSLPLLDAFHVAAEVHRAQREGEPELSRKDLARRVDLARMQENELVLDPALFFQLAQRLPRVSRVEIVPKASRDRNELSLFRYQAILHIAPEEGAAGAAESASVEPATAAPTWLDWRGQQLVQGDDLRALERWMQSPRGPAADVAVALAAVPEGRLTEVLALQQLLWDESEAEEATVLDLAATAATTAAVGPEVEDWLRLGRDLGRRVDLSWARHEGGALDVVLSPEGAPPPSLPAPEERRGALYNEPLLGAFARRVVPELRGWLEDRLPVFMVPNHFVLLAEFPRTPNGKIDRRGLPAPEKVRGEPASTFVAPRTATEELVAEVFAEVLAIDGVGAEDDFFALGGHSLLATRAVARLRERSGQDLALRSLFETSTVEELAQRLDAGGGTAVPEVDAAQRTVGSSLDSSLGSSMAGGEAAREAKGGAAPALGLRSAPPLVPVPRDRPLPLSFAQERLWFLSQLDADSSVYNELMEVPFHGPRDLRSLHRALEDLVSRHEILRTTYAEVDGRPVQQIAVAGSSFARPALPVVDLRGLPAERRGKLAAQLADRLRRRPFDLRRDLPLRPLLTLLEDHPEARDDARRHLAVCLHHIVVDGWSSGLLRRDMESLYESRRRGVPSPLPPPALHYADFAAWQRRWFRGPVLEAQLDFWRRQLRDLEPLELPGDRPRPTVVSGAAALASRRWDRLTTARLRRAASSGGGTLFMLLGAAFGAVVARMAGAEEAVFGTPVANRRRRELESVVGFFVNLLVLRFPVRRESSFQGLLEQVKERALEAFEAQDLPLEKLVEELAPDRDLSRNPFFQLCFQVLQSATGASGGASAGSSDGDQESSEPSQDASAQDASAAPTLEDVAVGAKFDLHLAVVDEGETLISVLEYRPELYDASTAARLLQSLEVFTLAALESVSRGEDRPLAALPLITDAQRHQLLAEWSGAGRSYQVASVVEEAGVQTQDLWSAFAAAAVEHSESPALGWGESWWSYGEVQARAEALAARLAAGGVGSGARVGLALERSPQLVVAMLATLRLGAAYVPLDPAFPTSRLELMAADANLAAVCADAAGAAAVPMVAGEGSSLPVLRLDTSDDPAAAALPPLGAAACGEALAYVLYTSGSTGRPKGVAVPHGAVLRLVQQGARWHDFGPHRTYLFHSPAAFDASTFEIWGALVHGARLAVLPAGPAGSEEVVRGAVAAGVDTLWLTAALFHRAVEEQGEELASIATVLAGGDVLDPLAVARFRELAADSGARLVNGYGPTENTTFTCCWRSPRWTVGDAAARDALAPVPVGHPVDGTFVAVVDRQLRPLPAGAVGELVTGGAGLAWGYVDQPARTAEVFVPDALSGAFGGRLYRTGDGARWHGDGSIDFLGRRDRQVKVRGHRVELGEVEAQLRTLPGVGEAVVAAQPVSAASSELRLVAWVGGSGEEAVAPDVAALRSALRRLLPEAFVPEAFVPLDRLPLTPAGKVDRRALPSVEAAVAPAAGAEAPRSAEEEIVAGVLAQVLERPRVGVEDDFFELGGHSLLATRAVGRLRQAFEVELPLSALFESPTPRALAARLIALRRGAGAEAPPLRPREDSAAPAPLSFAQERLWFLDQLEPGSLFYNMPHPVRLRGPLHPAALARALATVVERHQVLRSAFPAAAAATPVQRVLAAPGLELLPAVDLSGLPPEIADGEAHRLAAAEAARPFALDRGPLLRAALARLPLLGLPEGADASSDEAQDHVLLLTVHHAASDGWSTGLLLTELRTAYDSWRRGQAPTLAPLPVQYGDFAAWQRGWLEGERLEAQLDFWRRTLADHPMVLELPADRRRPAAPTFRGARHTLHLPAAEGLVAWGRGQGATAFMTLLAAFGATLGRLAVDDEPIIGTPVANRPRAELEGLIGFFVNSLPLRLSLQGDPSFATLVDRVRRLTLDAFAHQDVPFESLVEALRPARDLSRTPIFQVMFALQELPPGEELGLGEASLEAMAYGRDTVLFDLNLDLMAFEDGSFGGALEFSLDLFDVSTAARLASSFRELVASAAAAPETPVSQLRLLTAAQRHQLLLEDPGCRIFPGAGSAPSEILWSERFAAAVEDRGDAAALIHGEESMSFRELAAGAEAVAAQLIQRVGPLNGEAPVGLAAGRSLPAAAALLGILEAGAPFLTLDPSYPESRLRGMVSDAGLCAVVVDAAGREALAAVADLGVPLLALEELTDSAALSVEAAAAVLAQRPPIHPQQAAYLFYTSGSTGRPKGAVIRHQAFSEYVEACASALDLGPQDRFLQFASWSFDVAVEELFPAWSAGAAVVLAQPAELEQPESFQRRLEESKITAVELPTAFWQEWVRELLAGDLSAPEALRFVIVGGERMQRERLRDWQQLQQSLPESRRCRLIHVYGLTETTVTSSFHHALPGREVPLSGGELPVGRPLDPVRVQVLDRHGEPCPPGVEGEVYVGGPLVGGGYRGRPARTAQSFVPDPYGALFAAPGERLYRTGDRGRRLADGGLELLGRFDHQVKVRGFRVEPGEVEAALAALDGVAEAVVLLREDRPGDKRLVGYWTPMGSVVGSSDVESSTAEIGEGDLRRLLGERLPEHMVPSRLLRLDSLPLSPNGKVDRRALPAPEGRGELENPFVAPESAEEKALAALWSEVLGVEPIGLDDDFFGLGGHSLLATRLAAGIRRRFAVELPLRRLFEAPTVRQLAAVIAGSAVAPEGEAESGDIPLAPEGPAPLSFAQERLWFLEQLEGPSSLYNLPSSVRMRGALNRRALDQALSAIVRRHQALRTRFLAAELLGNSALGNEAPATEAAVYQLPLPSPHQVLRRVDLSGLAPELAAQELQRLAGHEARLPFDLASGELLRGVLVALSPDHHGLLFTVHHIASDAWSAGVLLQELGALYDAFRSLPEGEPEGAAPDEAVAAAVDPLPIQYSDFAAWQRQRLVGERLEAELAFWRQRLDASAAPLELPADRPRPPLQTFRGAHQRAFFGEDLRQPLGALARERRATPFAVLGAAFALLLSKLSGRRDLHLGVPWAGREHPQTQGLIGFFVNTLVLALEVDPEASFLDLVDQVRERLLEAQSHGEVPFEKLVEALAPKRNLAHSPLFQVLLNLEAGTGAEGEAAATTLPGLALEPLGMEVGTAKYDLTLALTDDGERLAGALEHNLDLFDATTARRWVAALRQLLSAALERPEGALGALSLLSAAQRHQVLAEQGAAPAAPPLLPGESALTLPQLLRGAAERWPTEPFLATPEGWLDRQTVWQRAQGVAAAVAALTASAPPEAPVAVLLERGPGALPVLVGLSLLGRPYVPLDPQHPATRLSLVLEDAGAVALVASDSVSLPAELQAHGDELPQLMVDAGGRVLAESGEAASIEGASESDFQSPSPDPSTLLYVLYTSGSTGRPKGVEISHRAALAFLRGMAQPDAGGEPLLTPQDHLLSVTTLAFDISFLELFLPFVTGARLQVATAAQSADGEALAALLSSLAPASGEATSKATSGRTVLQATPATWRLLLAVGWRPTAPFLALSGGEALPVPLAASLLEAGCQLRNLYGPTEATVWATSSALGASSRPVTAAAPLGRALPGYQTLVLDAAGEPVPAGVPGQLHLAGEALARGYRQRPALTAATFRPHGYRGDGERLYRTGDLVRRRPDGTLDFLGRIDHQLKLRGFRIESGEIEAVLEQQPAVRQAVVMLRLAPHAAEDSDPRLVAYIVAAEPGALDETRRDALESSLRQSLGERLPAYMQPSAWVFLEFLPLTPNGKVDRRALPQPEARRGAVGGQRVAPRNALERRLGALWAEVLGVPEVGRDDNFFELGGHSLLLVRLRQRLTEALGEELGREIPLVDLFRFPSVAALARHLAADLPERAPDAADARRRAAAKRQALEDRRRRRGPRGGRDPRRRR